MSGTCARCGLPQGTALDASRGGHCAAEHYDSTRGDEGDAVIACRDRQLALLHAQLRSVTRKVELAFEELAQEDGPPIERCRELLIQVLEGLA